MKLSNIMTMPQCRWTARHLHQYLDRDPSAPLTPEEDLRLTHHLEICAKCAKLSDEYRELSQALNKWRNKPDAESIQRLTTVLEQAMGK